MKKINRFIFSLKEPWSITPNTLPADVLKVFEDLKEGLVSFELIFALWF